MCDAVIVANDRDPATEHIPMTDLAKMTHDELLAFAQKMQANASNPRKLTFKVSEKGAISVYGLGRFPVTLYRGPMERLLAASDDIKAFIAANDKLLATKP